jgi:hypothetical protein
MYRAGRSLLIPLKVTSWIHNGLPPLVPEHALEYAAEYSLSSF